MARRKRVGGGAYGKGRGGSKRTRTSGLMDSLQAILNENKWKKANKLFADKQALEDSKNLDDWIRNLGYGFQGANTIIKGKNMWEQGKANTILAENYYPGIDPVTKLAGSVPAYELSDSYKNSPWYKKWATSGSNRVSETQGYQEWVGAGSPEGGLEFVRNQQKKMLAEWTESDPNFRVSTTHDGYVPGQDIVMGGQQPAGGPGNMIGADVGRVGDNYDAVDWLNNENTIIHPDQGQALNITKDARGQIIDIESGVVLDRDALNTRITNSQTDLTSVEKPAVNSIQERHHMRHNRESYDEWYDRTRPSVKVEGWKGKLGIYDTDTGFKVDYGMTEDDHFSASWKGGGWTETADGSLAYDVGIGDAVAIYSFYNNATTTNWDGQGMGDWSHDEWGSGLQMLGSALYFVPIPGARVVGTALNVIGNVIDKYGDKDEDWWFGENSVVGKLFGN